MAATAAGRLSAQYPSDEVKRFFTYRAANATFPDNVDPVVELQLPTSLEQGESVRPDLSCRDNGGSGLADCQVTGLNGGLLDTRTLGTHEVTITATDSAGNTARTSGTYDVTEASLMPSYPRICSGSRASSTLVSHCPLRSSRAIRWNDASYSSARRRSVSGGGTRRSSTPMR